jgi:hypothetical protein
MYKRKRSPKETRFEVDLRKELRFVFVSKVAPLESLLMAIEESILLILEVFHQKNYFFLLIRTLY